MFPEFAEPSGRDEWYTPPTIIEAARQLMGSIDLDPASCAEANKVVRAERWFGIKDDALMQPWHGNVWCNPPYGARMIRVFWRKLAASLNAGEVNRACFLTPMVDGAHCLVLLREAPAVVVLDWRIEGWWGPSTDGKTCPLGWGLMMISCFGVSIDDTRRAFSGLGAVR